MAVPPSGSEQADSAASLGWCTKEQAEKAKEIATTRASNGSTDINSNDAMQVLLEKEWITDEGFEAVRQDVACPQSKNSFTMGSLDPHVVVCVIPFSILPPAVYNLLQDAPPNVAAFCLGLSLIAVFAPSSFGSCRGAINYIFIWMAALGSLTYALMQKPITTDVLIYAAAGFLCIPLVVIAFFLVIVAIVFVSEKKAEQGGDK